MLNQKLIQCELDSFKEWQCIHYPVRATRSSLRDLLNDSGTLCNETTPSIKYVTLFEKIKKNNNRAKPVYMGGQLVYTLGKTFFIISKVTCSLKAVINHWYIVNIQE